MVETVEGQGLAVFGLHWLGAARTVHPVVSLGRGANRPLGCHLSPHGSSCSSSLCLQLLGKSSWLLQGPVFPCPHLIHQQCLQFFKAYPQQSPVASSLGCSSPSFLCIKSTASRPDSLFPMEQSECPSPQHPP